MLTEEPDKVSCMLRQIATGGVLSTTVTVALHEDELPASSVTVSVTLLAPRLAQVNEDGDTLREAMLQLSLLPPSTCAAVMLAEPPLSATVIFLQIATGGVLSIIVTCALQLEVLPEASVTVKVTTLSPRFEQSKDEGETDMD